MKKTISAIFIALFFYTLVDIEIWQRIFETNGLWNYATQYHKGWFLMLAGLIAIGTMFLYPQWKKVIIYSSSLLFFAFNGTEDVLYYFLDFRNIPEKLPWLDNSILLLFKPVSNTGLLISSIIWLYLWIIIVICIGRYSYLDK